MNEPAAPNVLEILEIGNEILRQKAAAIDDPRHPKLKELAAKMMATCLKHNGVGISAPQVGHSIRLIIVASAPNERYPDAPQMDPVVMINPQLVAQSSAEDFGLEGCLSIPGLYGQVIRRVRVVVSYLDLKGKRQCLTLEDFPARILQHELDHLDGTLFTDRAIPYSFITLKELDRKRRPS